MKEMRNTRVNIMLFLNILEKYSDEDHPLSRIQIVEKFSSEYRINIAPHTINEIANYFLSTECVELLGETYIERAKKGYYLKKRQFSQSEVAFLTDAVYSSKALTPLKAKSLVRKISSTLSVNQRVPFDNLYMGMQIDTNIEDTLKIIGDISNAINHGKQISFEYLTHNHEGKLVRRSDKTRIKVNPYYMVNNHGYYYLVSSEVDGTTIKTFRVDFITSVIEQKSKIIPIEELKEYKDKPFSLREYTDEHIYFVDGKVVDAQIVIHQTKDISSVKDWFGKNAKIYLNGNRIIADIRNDENALFFWCMQYSNCVTAIKPDSLVERLRIASRELVDRYSNELDTKEMISMDKIYSKYNLYLSLDNFSFSWDNEFIYEFYYEIKTTKPRTNKSISSIYLKRKEYTSNREKLVKPYYLLVDGKSRIISLIFYIHAILEIILEKEPDNKVYLDIKRKFIKSKLETLPNETDVVELKYDSLMNIANEDNQLENVYSKVEEKLKQLEKHCHRSNKDYYEEIKRFLDIAVKYIVMKVIID